uniref:Putative tail protein n=1 Tax=viral metagenome TaxID=1070528 RepID=A0A6M3MAI9_9ZZZZ
MADNYILEFARDVAATVLSDAEYTADGERIIGNQPGIAREDFVNKAMKQSTLMAVVLAQFIVDYAGEDVQDDDAIALILTNFLTALRSITNERRINKTQADTPYSVTVNDLDGAAFFTNTGATAEVVLNLLAGADGYGFKANVTAAYNIKFKANGTEKFRFRGKQSSGGGTVYNAKIGSFIEGKWNGTEWVVDNIGAPWSYT